MGEELELPDELFGFGGWLLWLVATRATGLVDRLYASGPARPSRAYGRVDGHHVPTPSLIAWLLTAAEFGVPPDDLRGRDARLDQRQKVLRTLVSRAVNSDPGVFKDTWLRQLAAVCALTGPELELLMTGRDYGPFPVEATALREAIERTFRSGYRRGRPAAATRTLPRDLASFTGRAGQLDRLRAVAGQSASGQGMAPILVISGMAGVGKTTLAVHAARRLSPLFPDGQIFLSLHGHSAGQRPVDPGDALLSLLLTAGLRAEQIPPGVEPRSRLWRDWLSGRRMLLILDDAISRDQIEPLLPGAAENLVLVTSRRRLTALDDAGALSLETLPHNEAAELFARLASREDLDSADVGALVTMCGGLPLAIALLASQLRHHPAWSAAELRADLAAARDRLDLMSAETRSVAAAFELSYRQLAPGLRRMFRWLALHPGAEFDVRAAAALCGGDLKTTRRWLSILYEHHLLSEPATGRFRFHDLIREYAAGLAAADGELARAAVDRLADYYLHAALAAGQQFERRPRPWLPGPEEPAVAHLPTFASAHDARSWLAAELPSLDAIVRRAAMAGRHQDAIAIPLAMHGFLLDSRHVEMGIGLHHLAMSASHDRGDLRSQAHVLACLCALHRCSSDFASALAHGRRAVEMYRALDDTPGEALACEELGRVQYLTGDYAAAAAQLTVALGLHRQVGDVLGEADVLTHLGYLCYAKDEFPAAREQLVRALDMYTAAGDRTGEHGALNYLASVEQALGNYPAAAQSLRRALDLCVAFDDVLGAAAIRNNLGYLSCLTGDYQAAEQHLSEALRVHEDLGNQLQQAVGHNYLGLAQRLLGRAQAAVTSQRRAVSMFAALGVRLGEGNAWQELGLAEHLAGLPGALGSEERALAIYRDLGDALGAAETMNNIGDLRVDAGQPDEARAAYEHALAMIAGLAAPMEVARAHEGVGRCLLRQQAPAAAETALRRALALYRQLGAPRAERVEELLGQGDACPIS